MKMSKESYKRQRAHLERRRKAAEEGRHLPTVRELFLGSPFMGGKIETDAETFAERALHRIKGDTPEITEARAAFGALTVCPRHYDFQRAWESTKALFDSSQKADSQWLVEVLQRCAFYCATRGNRDAAQFVAAEALALSRQERTGPYDFLDLTASALGWLAIGSSAADNMLFNFHARFFGRPHDALDIGNGILESHQLTVEDKDQEEEEPKTEESKLSFPFGSTRMIEPEAPQARTSHSSAEPANFRIVFKEIGNAGVGDGSKVKREFDKLLGRPLPIPAVHYLGEVRSTLIREFPYAEVVIDAILGRLSMSNHIQLRPTILVGKPGSGKTTFCQRLLELIGIRCMVYSCGGVSDSSLIGTPRRWNSGEPSLPVSLVRRWETAAPAIVLDEVEKVGTGTHNGNLLDGLLSLLEPQSASQWHDVYVESEVDLSAVIWFATANSVAALPAPLRDRCQIIYFPEPGPEHLRSLAAALMAKILRDRNLDDRWARPFDSHELEALTSFWQGGSIRRLSRLVECVLSVRESEMGRH